VNETLARQLWPGRSALGRRIRSDDSGFITWAEVIGVVGDVDTAANFSDPSTRLQIYKPLVHEPWAYANLVVRGPAPAGLAESLRRAVAEVDPELALDPVFTVRQFHRPAAAQFPAGRADPRRLCAPGSRARRGGALQRDLPHCCTTDRGIRHPAGLGAQRGDVLALVLNQGLRLALLGVALGLVGAFCLGRLLGNLLPRLGGADPAALGGVSAIIVAVALVACWLPARRATKVDPLIALRAE